MKLDLARWGEGVAAGFLQRRGATKVSRNVRIGRGELDLLVELGSALVAVEVKTIGATADHDDPVDRIDDDKLRQVRSLANQVARRRHRPVRVDFVGVVAGPHRVTVTWRTAVA